MSPLPNMFARTQLRSGSFRFSKFGSVVTTARGFQTTTRRYNSQYADGDLLSVKDRFSLAGKSYVITGGGRGIGYAAARAIAEYGGNVAIMDALPEPVKDFANLEREFGVKARYARVDVTNEKSLTTAFEETMADFGTLNGWYVFEYRATFSTCLRLTQDLQCHGCWSMSRRGFRESHLGSSEEVLQCQCETIPNALPWWLLSRGHRR